MRPPSLHIYDPDVKSSLDPPRVGPQSPPKAHGIRTRRSSSFRLPACSWIKDWPQVDVKSPRLYILAKVYCLLGHLTSDFYELHIEDLTSILWPDHVQAQEPIRLTDPCIQVHSPFIAISISGELAEHFAIQRRKVM